MKRTTPRHFSLISFSKLQNWSTYFILGNQMEYSQAYALTPIGQFLRRNKTPVKVQDGVVYKRPTIRMNSAGVLLRDEVPGAIIGTKNQFRISEKQFLMSKIDARNGAFGVVPPELDGGIITGNFWTFDVNYTLINPHYLSLLAGTKAFQALCQTASVGTTNRNYLQEGLFLQFEVPLPTLEEQRHLLEAYKANAALADQLRLDALELEIKVKAGFLEVLGISQTTQARKRGKLHLLSFIGISLWGPEKLLAAATDGTTQFPITTLADHREFYSIAMRGKSPIYDADGDHAILNQKCNRWNSIDLTHAKRVSGGWYASLDTNFFTQAGDILINSTGEGTIGRASLVGEAHTGFMYDSHMLLLRLQPSELSASYLVEVINSDYGQRQIEQLKSAQSTKQTELGIQNLLRIQFPLPPLEVQSALALELSAASEKAKQLRQEALEAESKALQDFEATIFQTTVINAPEEPAHP